MGNAVVSGGLRGPVLCPCVHGFDGTVRGIMTRCFTGRSFPTRTTAQTGRHYPFADDNVANRSSLAIYKVPIQRVYLPLVRH
jgi:hypothetical protein